MRGLDRVTRRNLLVCLVWVLRYSQRDMVRLWWKQQAPIYPPPPAADKSSSDVFASSSSSSASSSATRRSPAVTVQTLALLELCLEQFAYAGTCARKQGLAQAAVASAQVGSRATVRGSFPNPASTSALSVESCLLAPEFASTFLGHVGNARPQDNLAAIEQQMAQMMRGGPTIGRSGSIRSKFSEPIAQSCMSVFSKTLCVVFFFPVKTSDSGNSPVGASTPGISAASAAGASMQTPQSPGVTPSFAGDGTSTVGTARARRAQLMNQRRMGMEVLTGGAAAAGAAAASVAAHPVAAAAAMQATGTMRRSSGPASTLTGDGSNEFLQQFVRDCFRPNCCVPCINIHSELLSLFS